MPRPLVVDAHRDKFRAAKKVALALQSLISTQFPRDYLGLVGFSEVARELRAEQLPQVSWDFVFGTNIHHALTLARSMLARQTGSRQVVLITDGEPTAHVMADGEVFFMYPSSPQTLAVTPRHPRRLRARGFHRAQAVASSSFPRPALTRSRARNHLRLPLGWATMTLL